jgi:probable HAF family extracellular repeat protein
MACAAAVLACAAAAHAAKPHWSVTVLPNLTDNGGWARGINNRGDIVGTSGVAQYYPHPVIWSNGTVTDILEGNPANGVANAINDHGAVAATQRSGVIMWKDGVITPLGIAGEPQDINKSGGVVGYYYPSGEIAWGPQEGFYYHDGVLQTIGSLGNNLTAANGVNDKGVVVGYSRLPFSSTDHAVVWQNGVLRDLGTLGGTSSYAFDVTNHGLILGMADAPDGRNHMVAWDAVSGALIHDYGPRLTGYAINDHGAIVGVNLDTGKPFLLENGVYTWLLDLPEMRAQGWTSFSPSDINERGWIVGIGYREGSSNQGTAILLVPENEGSRPKD